ncbi:MAG: prepilin-type N-terminal cleavage/methylation domain-containing protein [Vicinamibacterales bacterium]
MTTLPCAVVARAQSLSCGSRGARVLSPPSTRGFSLVEVVVALAVGAIVIGGIYAVANAVHQTVRVFPSSADVQQRARAALDALARDARRAGSGGPGIPPLASRLAPAVPRRVGLIAPDMPLSAFPDRIAFIATEGDAAARVVSALPGAVSTVTIAVASPCPPGDPACGFRADQDVIVTDNTGRYDVGRLVAVSPPVLQMPPGTLHYAYSSTDDAWVVPVRTTTYYFDRLRRQLRVYDGYRSDLPLVDDVVAFSVEWTGDTRAPSRPRPSSGVANCLFDGSGAHRNPAGLLLPPGLVPLDLAGFRDGPTCGTGPSAFDVDLLRVRALSVRLRVQVADAALRGSDSRFAIAGLGSTAGTQVADVEAALDLSPPNLQARE